MTVINTYIEEDIQEYINEDLSCWELNQIPSYILTIFTEMFQLLEQNPNKYYNKLCEFKNIYTPQEIKQILDTTEYNTWYSNALQVLTFVVGDLEISLEDWKKI